MRKIYLSLLALFVFGISISFGQTAANNAGTTTQKSNLVEDNYARSSLTIVFLNFNEKDPYAKDLKTAFENLKVPEKYNDNQIDVKFVIPNFDMRVGNCAGSGATAALFQGKEPEKMQKINDLLKGDKATHKIVSKWFNKTADGKFDMNLIHQRGMYNANDAQFKDASLTERGVTTELKDAGKMLVGKSYVLAIDFGNILTMEQWYDIKDNRRKLLKQLGLDLGKKARTKEGFITDIKGYLFKLDGEIVQKVYDIWDEGSKFDGLDFPLVPITQIYYPRVEGTMIKGGGLTREQLFKRLTDNAVEWAEFMLARKVEDFRVKAPVNEGKGGLFPNATAKVGKKEGLKLDNRYFVWEMEEGKDGKKKSVRKGVIRVSNKIVDNREVTTGNTGTTKFYQVAGKKLEPGMLIQQRNDFQVGINVGAGLPMGDYEAKTLTIGTTSGSSTVMYKSPLAITARLDYNVSPYLAKIFTKWFTEMRVFGEVRILGEAEPVNKSTTTTNSWGATTTTTYPNLKSNMMISLGVSKDIHLMRNIKLSPFFQYAFGNSFEAGESAVNQLGFGARLPVNITHWMQLVPGITMFTPAASTAGDVYQDLILLSPMYIDAALRVSF